MPCSSGSPCAAAGTTGLVGIAVGTAMVAWILVELAFIRELSFFHPLYVAVGLLMVWAGFRVVRVDLGVPAASLAHELRDALADVPRFLAAPLMRRRHLRWGATDDEVAATLLGDDRLPKPDYVSTRALTIAAPPERVWPWLVQVGRGRAGFYSDDLLDNGAVPSAQEIRRRAAAAGRRAVGTDGRTHHPAHGVPGRRGVGAARAALAASPTAPGPGG